MVNLHETHVCRDCGTEITMPYVSEDSVSQSYLYPENGSTIQRAVWLLRNEGWVSIADALEAEAQPDWVGKPDENGDIHCSRLAPKRCMWIEGHYGGCATK